MRTTYPLGAALGLTIIGVVLMTAPVRDANDDESYVKTQRQLLAAQNKRLFLKLRADSEYMTFPVAAYKDDAK